VGPRSGGGPSAKPPPLNLGALPRAGTTRAPELNQVVRLAGPVDMSVLSAVGQNLGLAVFTGLLLALMFYLVYAMLRPERF
jgi:K+-transporting ATPase KdpF subunit